jgi:hypothetical protein
VRCFSCSRVLLKRQFAASIPLGAGWRNSPLAIACALELAGLDRYGSEKANTGFEPHALSFGGFVTNNLALMARWNS